MSYLDHDYKSFPELSDNQLDLLQFSSPHVQITEDFSAMVVKVTDGDTVTLRTDFRDFDFPLRLLDVDAPEMNAGGEVARDHLSALLTGQEVQVLVDSNNRVGKYGRLLGRILFNGIDVAQEMVYLGLIKEFGSKLEGQVPSFDKVFSEVTV